MGTRADFYVGRGESAEWIGSIAWDGDEDGFPAEALKAADETSFRAAVAKLASSTDAGFTEPKQGWPWPWDTSHTTDYAYAWDSGSCWVSRFGGEWCASGTNPEGAAKMGPGAFPRMKVPDNPFHERSGVMVFGIRPR